MRKVILCALFAASVTAVTAQGGSGQIPLPPGVGTVVSNDAQNELLAVANEGQDRSFARIKVRHVYSGGLARLLGGDVIPAYLLTPAAIGGAGQQGLGGFAGQQGLGGFGQQGLSGFGGQQGFGGLAGSGGFQGFGAPLGGGMGQSPNSPLTR